MASTNPEILNASNQHPRLSPSYKLSNDNQSIRPSSTNAYNSSLAMAPAQAITGQPRYSYSPAAKLKTTPVIQYPIDNGLERATNNATYKPQNQQIQQRIIMDEPQSFSQRIDYNNAYEIKTPVFQSFSQPQKPIVTAPIQENENVIAQTVEIKPSTVEMKPSTVDYYNVPNPLVQTIQDNWYDENQIAKDNFAPPKPAPRDAKICCSPWIIALIGLLALLTLIVTILVGKQTSHGSQVSVTQKVPVGNVVSVSPIPLLNSSQITSVSKGQAQLSSTNPNTIQGTTSVTPISSTNSNASLSSKDSSSTLPSPPLITPKTVITNSSSTVSLPPGNSSVANQTSSSPVLPPNSIPALEV